MKHPTSSKVDEESPSVKKLLLPELICNLFKLLLLTIRKELLESLPNDHVVAMDFSDVCARQDLYTVFVNPSSEVAKFDAVCEFTFICSDSSWKPFAQDQPLSSSREVALDQAEFTSLYFLIIYVHS